MTSSRTSPLVHRPAEWFFTGLARLRRAPAFHPRGTVVTGTLHLDDGPGALCAALGAGDRPVEARLSRGVGLPAAWPDVLGVALRVPASTGPVDLLMTTVAPGRLGSYLLLPSPRWTARRYSTLLPYVGTNGPVVIGLQPLGPPTRSADVAEVEEVVAGRGLELDVLERSAAGGWQVVGRVRLDRVTGRKTGAFDPVRHAHPDLPLAPLLTGLRAAAYTGSRRGRGVPDARDPGP